VIGETIKEFRITAQLGQGGWGEVWAAEQQLVRTRVAIKLLSAQVSSDERHVQRFFNEAIAVSKIHHSGIVKIFDVGFHAGRAFLIMELLEGETLASRLRRSGHLPVAQIIDVGHQITSVLQATHAAGITHRDLKPDNVFLVPDAGIASGERAKILDFGIAKLGDTGMTATGGSMGTPGYMAPEQWNDAAKADSRADVYALGCVVFELYVGRPPFVAASIGEACTKHLHEVPPRVRTLAPNTPVELDDLVARMLAKAPEDRPTLVAIAETLGALASASPPAAAIAATLGSDTRLPRQPADDARRSALADTTLGSAAASVTDRPRRSRRGLVLGIAGVVAVAGGTGIFLSQRGGADDVAAALPPPTAPPPPAPVLHEPKLGLSAIEQLHDPTTSAVSNLHSESLWTAARGDFEEACKQPGAPARWCAARELADGEIALVHHDQKAALAAYHRAASRDPSWAMPQLEIAGSLAHAHDLAGAIAAAGRAQRLEPKWWQAVAAGARAYAAENKLDDAIQEYRRALALAPKNALLLAEVALAYHAARIDGEALKYGDQALAIDDNLVPVHLMRAELALEHGDAKTALAETERVIGVAPKNTAAHLARGDAFALQYKKAEAFEEYRHTVELGGADTTSLPEQRLATVRAAMANNRLPPRRGAVAPTRSKPSVRALDSKPERSRPGCNANDPLCSLSL